MLRQTGHLPIAQLDNHPVAIQPLRHIHREKAALHLLGKRLKSLNWRLKVAIIALIPIGCGKQQLAIEEEEPKLFGQRHAAFGVVRQRLKWDKLTKDQALIEISALQFKKARDMAAWLGLVPQQYSTGGRTQMLGISKRGNRYVRRLLIHGARSCMMHLDRSRDRLGAWIDRLQSRMHVNKVTVALAAKIARIAWVVINRPGAIYERRDPAIA